jgi:hypothetical protein
MKSEKVKLKRKDLLDIYAVLSTTNFDNPINSKFRYAVNQNIKNIKEEIKQLKEAFPFPKDTNIYNKERNAILSKYNVKLDADYAKLTEDAKKSIDAELTALEEKNKKLLDEIVLVEKDRESFIEEETEFSLFKIDLELVPTISSDQKNNINGWGIWKVLEKIIIDPKLS